MYRTAKDMAKHVIDQLPDWVTLDDVIYGLYVCQKVESGLNAVVQGRTVPHDEVKRQLRDGIQFSVGSKEGPLECE